MNLETKHSDLISWLQLEFPELVQSMKDADHHYDAENLNPYHLEGDVWTHTNMVFKNSEHFSPDNNYVKWSTMLHDVGKPLAREEVPERKRVRFIGHEGVSAFLATDILNKSTISEFDKIHIFQLVAMHGNLFNHIKADGTIKSDTVDVFKGMKSLLSDLTHQVRADSLGRWYQSDKQNDSLFTSQLPENFAGIIKQLDDGVPEGDLSAPTLTVLVGPPCSEKSTTREKLISENPDLVVISRDDFVESFGKSKGMNYGETYQFLRDNPDVEKEEIANKVEALKNQSRKENKSVVIDFTSMSKKSRKKWINEFKNYNKKCILFVKGYDELVKCAEKRGQETGKKISEKVIFDMCKRFSLPMYSEGFTEIEYEWIPPRF
jgi:predicted kinase